MRLVVALAVCVATSRLAAAQPAAEPMFAPPGLAPLVEPAAPKTEVVEGSYRLQIAASDAVATALILASDSSSSTAPYLALATYALAPAAIHLAHGHAGRALGSVALRALLPTAGAYIGAGVLGSGGKELDGAIAGLVLGGLGGVITASAIDIGYLGRAEQRPARTIVPTIAPCSNGGMSVGVGGTF